MAKTARDDELAGRKRIRERLLKIYEDVEKAFENQKQRSDAILDYWDMYNCVLGGKQYYNGNSKIFVPIIQVAINARSTRFTNQMFPQNGRHVQVTAAGDDKEPLALVALLEKYVHDARLRTQVMPALCVNGDVEGQYNVYVDWNSVERHVVSRATKPVRIGGVDMPEAGEVETIEEETIEDAGVGAEVLHDTDVVVWPTTVDSLDQALEVGGGFAIIRRWTKAKIEQMRDAGAIEKDPANALVKAMSKVTENARDARKSSASVAGVRLDEGSKIAVVFEAWIKLKVDGARRICRVYFGGPESKVLGCKLNPYWCDLVPLLSAPVKKVAGLFKGTSLIKFGVIDLQLQANDAINEAMDALPYHLAPLIAVDPETVQRWESLVMDVGAVWPVPPDAIKQIVFTDVTQSALSIVGSAKAAIFEALSVNPAMMAHQTGKPGTKRNQAEIALEQQVDVMTTADAVTNIENEILTPFVTRTMEYDHQFRTEEIRVAVYGELGARASMQIIPPQQRQYRYTLSWLGVEAARDAARIQQQIAFFGVLQKFPAQLYQGYRLNAVPMITRAVENIFGATLGSQIFESVSAMYTLDPEAENGMMEQTIAVKVHPLDDDAKHLQVHMALVQSSTPGTPENGLARDHVQQHQMQMQMKAAAQAQQQQGRPGAGGPPGPGGARGPEPGAQPGAPRPMRQPPGAIPQDRMPAAGALTMPRKT